MTDAAKPEALAVRVEDFTERLKTISELSESGQLSPEGTSNAVALLTATRSDMFPKIAQALRARAKEKGAG